MENDIRSIGLYQIKRKLEDILFSKIVRFGKTRCQKCNKVMNLQCCHVFGRRNKSTRWNKRNVVVLCSNCHKWFDGHKIMACLIDKHKRVFAPNEESFHWLVSLGYTWDELLKLYETSHQVCKMYPIELKELREALRAELKGLEKDYDTRR